MLFQLIYISYKLIKYIRENKNKKRKAKIIPNKNCIIRNTRIKALLNKKNINDNNHME